MERPTLEVADIFGRFGASFLQQYPTTRQQRRVMAAITACRTPALGGHVERCDHCGYQRNAYNSCRDRHCPKCGALAREQWIKARTAELLPIPYFHLVFTLPEFLRPVAWQNQTVVYDILFRSAASALQKVAADPRHLGARIGLVAVLHTWTQQLLYHPHIHCIVSGGGPSLDGTRWVAARNNYFLPVRVLSDVYRGVFMQALRQAWQEQRLSWHGELEHLSDPVGFNCYIQEAWEQRWVVYAKAPFAGPQAFVQAVGRYTHGIGIANHRLVDKQQPAADEEQAIQVVDYLGKHANRIAITNDRIVNFDADTVTFWYPDRRQGGEKKLVTISGHEFIRRFLMHVLPPHFVRIRHYGFLANAHRSEQLALCRTLLQVTEEPQQLAETLWKDRLEELTGVDIDQCPECAQGRMHNVATLLTDQSRRPRFMTASVLIVDTS